MAFSATPLFHPSLGLFAFPLDQACPSPACYMSSVLHTVTGGVTTQSHSHQAPFPDLFSLFRCCCCCLSPPLESPPSVRRGPPMAAAPCSPRPAQSRRPRPVQRTKACERGNVHKAFTIAWHTAGPRTCSGISFTRTFPDYFRARPLWAYSSEQNHQRSLPPWAPRTSGSPSSLPGPPPALFHSPPLRALPAAFPSPRFLWSKSCQLTLVREGTRRGLETSELLGPWE